MFWKTRGMKKEVPGSFSGKLKGLLACCVDSKLSIVAFVWLCFRYFVIMKRPYQGCI